MDEEHLMLEATQAACEVSLQSSPSSHKRTVLSYRTYAYEISKSETGNFPDGIRKKGPCVIQIV